MNAKYNTKGSGENFNEDSEDEGNRSRSWGTEPPNEGQEGTGQPETLKTNRPDGQGGSFVDQIRAITGETDVSSKVGYHADTLMEVDIGYRMENRKKKNLVINFKTDAKKYTEINLSVLNRFVRDVVVDNGVSSVFSSSVKFFSAKIRLFRPSETYEPYFQTPNQTISGIYGKMAEGPFHLPYCIKFSRSNEEYHQRGYLYGLPFSINYWDSPGQGSTDLLDMMKAFSAVFLAEIIHEGITFRSIGLHKISKKKGVDYSERYYPDPPVVIGIGYEGFVKRRPPFVKL